MPLRQFAGDLPRNVRTLELLRNGLILTLVTVSVLGSAPCMSEALKVDPRNPHYLIFRGTPVVLIGSSEHYGSVLNRDFNYVRYLNTLRATNINITRLFTGQYHERPGKFGVLPSAGIPDIEIVDNTLAPTPDGYLAPWPRSSHPGAAADGGRRFDLSQWNPDYFRRLRDFVLQASRRGIVVEISLFSSYYVAALGNRFWEVSPWNSRNNINGIGNISGEDALTLKDVRLVAIQDSLVKKIVDELHEFDNIYYEICNEPNTGKATLDWQRHIVQIIETVEAHYSVKHLIAQELGMGARKAEERIPQTSLIAFHNSEGESVTLNYGLNAPIIHNETIFDYTDAANRVAAWRFLLSGGAMYVGADYSFTVGHEDGTFVVPPGGAGGGSASLRQQLQVLHRFMDDLPYTKMFPENSIIHSALPADTHAYTLGDGGSTYAIYLYCGHSDPLKGIVVDQTPHHLSLLLAIPTGYYSFKWIDPKSDAVIESGHLTGGGSMLHKSQVYAGDIALLIRRLSTH